jgi:hypothetical protein
VSISSSIIGNEQSASRDQIRAYAKPAAEIEKEAGGNRLDEKWGRLFGTVTGDFGMAFDVHEGSEVG